MRWPDPILTPRDASWGRFVSNKLDSLERNRRIGDADQNMTNKGLAASLGRLGQTLDAVPIAQGHAARTSGFSVGTSFTTIASVAVPRIAGKRCMIVANGSALISWAGGDLNIGETWLRITVSGGGNSFETFCTYGFDPPNIINFAGLSTYVVDVGGSSGIAVNLQARNPRAGSFTARSVSAASLGVVALHRP